MIVGRFLKLHKIMQNPILLNALLRGVFAGVEHNQVLQSHKCELVVDIGANRGQFALVARKCFPSAKIICFEPLSEPVNVLKKVFRNDPLTVIHEIAIGESEAQSPIHISKHDDSSSLLPITSLQAEIYPGTEEKETRLVQVKPLESMLTRADIKQPALLKIDVQGYESEVLRGCQSLLPCFSYVYVECSFIQLYTGQSLAHEIISFLDKKGFILSGIYNLSYDKKGLAIQGDFLFARQDSK